jgi:hypothetical protein
MNLHLFLTLTPTKKIKIDYSLQAYAHLPTYKPTILPTTWIGDSGASCHMCHHDDGMFDCQQDKTKIKIGNGKLLTATKIFKLKLRAHQLNG